MERSAAGTTRFALRAHSRIAYDPGAAPEHDSNGHPVVLLLHDLLADRGQFAELRSGLSGIVRIVSPDTRGHGASASLKNQWYSMSELAADAQAVLDAESISHAVVVGFGLGGATALELAKRAPGRVVGLVLIEPAIYGLLDNELDAGARRLRDEFRSGDRVAADAAYKGMTEKALDLYLGPRWGTGWREQVTAARLGAIRRHAGALSGLLPAIDGYSVAKSELAEIVTPTLVVIGEDAAPVDRLVAERLVRALPNGIAEETTFGPRGGSPFTGAFAESANDLITHFIQRLAH